MMLGQDMPAEKPSEGPRTRAPSGEFTGHVPGVPAPEASALNPCVQVIEAGPPGPCLLRSQPLQGEGNKEPIF